ncbi:haloacid dehalogenase [Phycisphaerae bacterium]|jgi:beta-phosphoglucomutase|nr:haloacid dehalogenase [Phycisphaerae bacterium]
MSALLFDFDGVIVHSEPLHYAAISETFAAHNMHFSEETYYQRYVAYADRDLFPIIARDCNHDLTAEQLETMLEEKWTRFAALVKSKGVEHFDATLDLISHAHACNITIALCTAAMRRDVDLILGQLNILSKFATIVSANDVPKSKPDPAPYSLACKRLNKSPQNCVALEDTPGGIASALGAGCKVIGVCHTLPAHRLHQATRVVASSRDLTVDAMLAMLTPLWS